MDFANRRPYPQWRFLQLTLIIVGWLLVQPLLQARWSGHAAMQVMLLDLMLVTLWANPGWRSARQVLFGLWALSLLASLASVFGIMQPWRKVDDLASAALSVPVTVACAIGVLQFAFRAEKPTLDGIFAMVVVYFLIALLFAEFFFIALVFAPDAMHLLRPVAEMTPRELRSELIYYSLVTISTVGYGDVLPVAAPVRVLAVVEAVLVLFVVAVVVATFVAKWVSHRARETLLGGRRD